MQAETEKEVIQKEGVVVDIGKGVLVGMGIEEGIEWARERVDWEKGVVGKWRTEVEERETAVTIVQGGLQKVGRRSGDGVESGGDLR